MANALDGAAVKAHTDTPHEEQAKIRRVKVAKGAES